MKKKQHGIMSKFIAWVGLSRPPFHTVGILPFLLGALLAWKITGAFGATIFILGMLAVVLVMLSTKPGPWHVNPGTQIQRIFLRSFRFRCGIWPFCNFLPHSDI